MARWLRHTISSRPSGSPAALGMMLFNQYLLPFEITSVILLTALVGAIVLTRKSNGSGK